MCKRGLKRPFTAILVLMGTTVAPVFASVIYTNFGAGDSFDFNEAWIIGPTGNNNQVIGASFTTTTSIQFADAQLALESPGGSGSGTTADVYLESDSGGNPGSILDTLVEQSPISEGIVTFDCSLCPTLSAATTYWIVAAEGNGSTDWFFNDTGVLGAAYDTNGSDTGPWTDSTTQATPAFEVDGPASSVPEPNAFLLLSIALVGMGFAARRKARRCL